MKICITLLAMLISFNAGAALLSCESGDVGEQNSQPFISEIYEDIACNSGYATYYDNGNYVCALFTQNTIVYLGPVRGCGYYNGDSFVIDDLLPLGAE